MAIWRLRKACGVIQSEFKGLRNGGADDVDSSPIRKAWEPALRAGWDLCPSSAVRQEEPNSSSLHVFVLFYFIQWIGWCLNTGDGKLLYWVHQFRFQFHPEIASQPCPEVMFCQISGFLVKLTNYLSQVYLRVWI